MNTETAQWALVGTARPTRVPQIARLIDVLNGLLAKQSRSALSRTEESYIDEMFRLDTLRTGSHVAPKILLPHDVADACSRQLVPLIDHLLDRYEAEDTGSRIGRYNYCEALCHVCTWPQSVDGAETLRIAKRLIAKGATGRVLGGLPIKLAALNGNDILCGYLCAIDNREAEIYTRNIGKAFLSFYRRAMRIEKWIDDKLGYVKGQGYKNWYKCMMYTWYENDLYRLAALDTAILHGNCKCVHAILDNSEEFWRANEIDLQDVYERLVDPVVQMVVMRSRKYPLGEEKSVCEDPCLALAKHVLGGSQGKPSNKSLRALVGYIPEKGWGSLAEVDIPWYNACSSDSYAALKGTSTVLERVLPQACVDLLDFLHSGSRSLSCYPLKCPQIHAGGGCIKRVVPLARRRNGLSDCMVCAPTACRVDVDLTATQLCEKAAKLRAQCIVSLLNDRDLPSEISANILAYALPMMLKGAHSAVHYTRLHMLFRELTLYSFISLMPVLEDHSRAAQLPGKGQIVTPSKCVCGDASCKTRNPPNCVCGSILCESHSISPSRCPWDNAKRCVRHLSMCEIRDIWKAYGDHF